jgi:hypothetical protein
MLITKVTFTLHGQFFNIHFVVWQFWGRAAEASWTERSKTLFYLDLPAKGLRLASLQHALQPGLYFEHAEQYPPISNRETTMRKRQSFST